MNIKSRGTPSAVALLALLMTGCARTPVAPRSDAPVLGTAGSPHARNVVVSIVVDQEAAWIADERWPLLPADGGFARLRREGTYAREVRYAHSVTDTAPGHAALYTGLPPRGSGVWGNEVLDEKGAKVSILTDPATHLVTSEGITAKAGSSLAPSFAPTIADRLRDAHADALIASISIKDRGAIFAGGRHPTASIWFNKGLDRFVTATVFAPTLPPWVSTVDVAKLRAKPWDLLEGAWVKSHAATPDEQPGEGGLGGIPITFPHDVAHATAPATAFIGSPFADDAVFALALAAIDAEHAGDRPTLIALSLSANDYIGHAYGPDSWEAWDELRRLDASLARFFAQLDARFGESGWSAILSADHGVTTMPEVANGVPSARPWCAPDAKPDRWERSCEHVGRIFSEDLARELGPDVRGIIDPYVYLTPAARALPEPAATKLRATLAATILRHPEVARVIDTRTIPASCPPESDASIDALVCRSFVPGKAGDLYVVAKRGSFFDPDVVVGKGSSHGSPYLFDRTVPLLVRAPGKVTAGRVIDEPLSFRTFARTLSTLLGVEPPDADAPHATDLARPTP
jgi:predicted AlkP superfamily pyrophosphatase or phosphodiesterase